MTIAFMGGQIIVGDGRVFDSGTVIVEDARIVKVTEGEASVPREARKVDLGGRTLLPGFIDCHVHLCLDGGPDPASSAKQDSLSTMTLKAAEFARRTLMAGVTTLRDMGGIHSVDLAVRDAVRSGLINGPRILASGKIICMTGGTGWTFGGREADGPHEVRKAVREQIKAGADLIKLMATGGVITPGVEPGCTQFTEEELSAGVEEAHKAGRKTAAHAQGTRGILNALRAGIDSIEHGIYMDEETVSLMVDKKVPFIPTLSPLINIERNGVEGGVPEFAVNKTNQVKPFHLESIRMAREAGVIFAMGTDTGCPFSAHGANLNEVVFFVDQGFSPLEAITAATRTAANTLGLQAELGTIEEGKLADLVIVQGNPLDDISLLAREGNIPMVMQGGRILKQ